MSEHLLTLSMIVKNEEMFLADCLRSVEGIVDEIIIVDTGSTDRTVEIAKSFGARVIEIEWPHDFAKARNVGLDAVTTQWVLIMDADEEFVREDTQVLREAITHPSADAYNIRIISLMDRAEDITESYVTRLVRSHPQLRFQGAVHEQLFHSVVEAKMTLRELNVRLTHKGYLNAVMKERDKHERNRRLLESHVARNPQDIYMLWQLSQSYFGESRFDEALLTVRRALKLATQDNPIWTLCMTTYARILVQMGQRKKAIRVLQDGKLAHPKYTDFWYQEGIIHFNLKEWVRAEACFQECLALGEAQGYLATDTGIGGFKSLYRIAQTWMMRHDGKQALAYLLLTLKQQPLYRSAWRGVFELMAGQTIGEVGSAITLSLAPEVIVQTLSSWPDPDDNEKHLLAWARERLSTLPANQQG